VDSGRRRNLHEIITMAKLEVIEGPDSLVGRAFALDKDSMILGRDQKTDIVLPVHSVSRRHARLVRQASKFFLEDLGSTHGVYVNGQRVDARVPLDDGDELRITDLVLRLTLTEVEDPPSVIRDKISVDATNDELYALNPRVKLQMILDLSRHLSRALDQETLLKNLLEYLLKLFPLADQGLVALWRKNRLEVREQQTRKGRADFPYSRTLLKQALAEEAGILSEDVRDDQRFVSETLVSSEARSALCVPLFDSRHAPLGVVQLTCCRPDKPFQHDDLHMLSTIALQVAVVLENAALNDQRLREAELRQELAMARDIQQSCLPADFGGFQGERYELFGKVWPAHDVSGDLYDFLPLDEQRPAQGRLAFFLGDVSGKGMPAALFMFAVRALSRHLALAGTSPAQTLTLLNQALARDNASALFVTMVHGILDRDKDEILLTTAGHCLPLLRAADGTMRQLEMPSGRFLGFEGNPELAEIRLVLHPGDSLIVYTDGCTESFAQGGKEMFGLEGLRKVLQEEFTLPIQTWADRVKERIVRFGKSEEPQDDLTLLILHRKQ
jgi:serine phosphatase RsbU (regulator of sigma subunit)